MPHHTEDPAKKAADIARRVTEEAQRNGHSVDHQTFLEIHSQALAEFVFPSKFPIETPSQ